MRTILICCLCLFIATSSYAQTIIELKSGETFEGELIEKTDEYIKLKLYDIVLTYWMDEIESVESKAAITIKGNVIFDDYQQGFIRIRAFVSKDHKPRQEIASIDIPRPGPYTLRLPFGTKKVYITGYNDSDGDGFSYEKGDPVFWYGRLSASELIIDAPLISNIDLKAHTNQQQNR